MVIFAAFLTGCVAGVLIGFVAALIVREPSDNQYDNFSDYM